MSSPVAGFMLCMVFPLEWFGQKSGTSFDLIRYNEAIPHIKANNKEVIYAKDNNH
jgi:hypothetical protein